MTVNGTRAPDFYFLSLNSSLATRQLATVSVEGTKAVRIIDILSFEWSNLRSTLLNIRRRVIYGGIELEILVLLVNLFVDSEEIIVHDHGISPLSIECDTS